MKRKLLIMILCLGLMLSSVSSVWAATFTDTGNGELAMAAAVLQGMDVVAGTSDTTFDPQGPLTRAQACTMLVKMMGLDSNLSTGAKKNYFSDVPSNAWYAPYVNLAYSNNLINGYGNGKFGPDDYISYGQLATIILRMLGYTTADIGYVWPADYTSFSEDLGISADFTIGDNSGLTRGQAALMLYRSLTCKTKGGRQDFYETIADVASTKEIIVMSVNAERNGSTGLIMGYSLSQNGETVYVTQENTQSQVLEGCSGKLLLNSSGEVTGFLPTESNTKDLELEGASLSYLTAGGTKYRIASTVLVLDSKGESSWSSGGYLKALAKKGQTVRVYFDSDGSVKYVYLFGGETENNETAALYRVSGYISAVSPSLVSTERVTIAGSSFQVSEAAAASFSAYRIGDKVSIYLDSDLKVCAVDKESIYSGMLGVLAADGKSVTLVGSGVKLSGKSVEFKDKQAGGLVNVTESEQGTLKCSAAEETQVSGDIDLEAMTVGTTPIAAQCYIYEWTGSGYLCSLEGVRGEASGDFGAITWTETIPKAQVSWCRKNAEGQVDVIILKDVAGSCYSYGYLDLYTDREGIDLGSGTLHAYNRAGVLTGANGSGQKSLCVITQDEGYCGVAYGYSNKNSTIVSVQTLSKFEISSIESLALTKDSSGNDQWQADSVNTSYDINDNLQVYNEADSSWSKGISTCLAFLESGYTVTMYYDRAPEDGGSVRIAVINK